MRAVSEQQARYDGGIQRLAVHGEVITCKKCGTRPRAEFVVRRDGWGYLTARHLPCHMRVRLGVRYAAKQALKTGKEGSC